MKTQEKKNTHNPSPKIDVLGTGGTWEDTKKAIDDLGGKMVGCKAFTDALYGNHDLWEHAKGKTFWTVDDIGKAPGKHLFVSVHDMPYSARYNADPMPFTVFGAEPEEGLKATATAVMTVNGNPPYGIELTSEQTKARIVALKSLQVKKLEEAAKLQKEALELEGQQSGLIEEALALEKAITEYTPSGGALHESLKLSRNGR